ncbi:MAG TPA: class I SAM-dependent methyltransferase [Sedimentisphaerales bacterium]|nr:class I SAM-dependent methyltransferase [Sedimentisphaerales bacterium]
MSNERRDFDREAAAWDENPARVKLAEDVAGAILRQAAVNAEMDALDFGCGTGLLTLRLAPLVRSVTGVDSSQGMLDVLAAKVAKGNMNNVKTLCLDLDRGDTLPVSYDLIVSSMTLHHIERIDSLLAKFHAALLPGGRLCLADLDLDDGQFHSDNQGVFHFGFDRASLRRVLEDAGFANVQDATAAEVVKPGPDGKLRSFSILLMTGCKKGIE